MTKYLLAVGLLCGLGFGCTTALTQAGAAVQPVTDAQKDRACEFISIVTGSESDGISESADAESAMNKVRNKVAKAGGNAMRIISTTATVNATTVTAEALKCDKEKLRTPGN